MPLANKAPKSFVVGITGGIGSGKSLITDHLQKKNICVVDADIEARNVVLPGSAALKSIAARFGDKVLSTDNNGERVLDRRKLRDIVFSDDKERLWLESLTHPLIRQNIVNKLNSAESSYAVLSSPLLIESEQNALTDRIAVVDATVDQQISRASERDDDVEQQVRTIISKQLERKERIQYADDIIDNTGSSESALEQVDALHIKWLALAQESEQTS